MPASRSRTERWRECLDQIFQRQGGIELTLPVTPQATAPTPSDVALTTLAGIPREAAGKNLLWRVRLLRLSDTEIVVERPSVLGQTIDLADGLELIAVMAIGQNRWMFRTHSLGHVSLGGGGRPVMGLRLSMPTQVERCRRREHERYSTGDLNMPPIQGWPVLEPASVVAAEVANQAQVREAYEAVRMGRAPGPMPLVLPEVGPMFSAQVANVGGGGAGIVLPSVEASALDRSRVLFLRVDLTPHVPAPVGVTARLVHQHLDSGMNVHAGLCFDFSFNPGHREFVADQMKRYINALQAGQVGMRKAA